MSSPNAIYHGKDDPKYAHPIIDEDKSLTRTLMDGGDPYAGLTVEEADALIFRRKIFAERGLL